VPFEIMAAAAHYSKTLEPPMATAAAHPLCN